MPTPSPTPGDVGSIPTESSFEDTLTAVCEAAVRLVGVDHSGLVLFSQDRQSGTVRAEYPPSIMSAVGREVPLVGVPLEEKLIASRQPIVVNDVASEDSLGLVQKMLLDLGVKSLVIVPIIVDGEVKGSFSFDSVGAVREFKESDVDECSGLAEFASIVVKNAYLIKNLEALRKAMLAVASEEERVPLLKAITQEAVNLLQANGGGIGELDERRGELTIVAQFNISDDIVGKTMKVGEDLAGLIIKDNLDFFTAPNYSEWNGRAPYFKDATILESLIGVPLRLNNKPTGVLWLNAARHREFTAAEIDLLQGFAAPASVALEQSELREKERAKATRLAALATATSNSFVALATKSRKETLTLIAKFARDITEAETCEIFLVNTPGWLTLVAGDGYRGSDLDEGMLLAIKSGAKSGLTGHIAFEGSVFRGYGSELTNHFAVKDKSREANYSPSAECFSLLAIPLKTESGDLRGLIRLGNKNDKDGRPNQWTSFTDDDEAIGEIFAHAALMAIETSDLLDEIRKVRTVALTGAAARLWRHGLKPTAELIVGKLNYALSLSDLDSIKEVLSGIKNNAKYIADFPFTPLSSDENIQDEMLNEIVRADLEGLRNILSLEDGEVSITWDLSATDDRTVKINKSWFQQALYILLENAREALKGTKEKVIEIRTEMVSESGYRLVIKNSGKKIEPEIWEKMGNEQIKRADGDEQRGGGLLIADLVLAVYGGKLEKIANDENNIVMGLTLPISSSRFAFDSDDS